MKKKKEAKKTNAGGVVSTAEERRESGDEIRIEITLSANGAITTTGPMKDPALFLGILELAKLQFTTKAVVGQIQASGMVRGNARPRIVSPYDGRPLSS